MNFWLKSGGEIGKKSKNIFPVPAHKLCFVLMRYLNKVLLVADCADVQHTITYGLLDTDGFLGLVAFQRGFWTGLVG